jgi:hypothetical protein
METNTTSSSNNKSGVVAIYGEKYNKVKVIEDYAYVIGVGGLKILDIESPNNPKLIGQCNLPYDTKDLTMINNYLYLFTHDDYLQILDVSDKTNPLLIESFYTKASLKSKLQDDNYLYFYGPDGLKIVDITDKPKLVSSYNSYVSDLVIEGDYAYIADYYQDFLILDISDKNNPTLTGRYSSEFGNGVAVAIDGNYAYFHHSYRGLKIIDISDKTNPQLVTRFYTDEWTGRRGSRLYSDIYVQDNYVYVIDSNYVNSSGRLITRGIKVDVIDKKNPKTVELINKDEEGPVEDPYKDITKDNYAYEITSTGALVVLDISDKNNSKVVKNYYVPNPSGKVIIDNNYAYSSAGYKINQFNIKDKSNPELLDRYYEGVDYMAIQDNYMYITDNSTLKILDITDKSNFKLMGSCFVGGASCNITTHPERIVIQDEYVYVTSGRDGLKIVDVKDKYNPVSVGHYGINHNSYNPQEDFRLTGEYAFDIAVKGNYAYLATWQGGLKVLDITDKRNPVLLKEYCRNETQYCSEGINKVIIEGDYAYIQSIKYDRYYVEENDFVVLDITDKKNPKELGEYKFSKGTTYKRNGIWDMSINENYIYLTDYAKGLTILDITDKSKPLLSKQYKLAGSRFKVTLDGDYAYIAANEGGFTIIKVK